MFFPSRVLPFVHSDWLWFSFDAVDFEHHVESPFEHLEGSFVSTGEISLCQEAIKGGDVCVDVAFIHHKFLQLSQGCFLGCCECECVFKHAFEIHPPSFTRCPRGVWIVLLFCVQDVKLPFGPAIDVVSLDVCQDKGGPGVGVFHYFFFVIDRLSDHDRVKEFLGSHPIPIENGRSVPHQGASFTISLRVCPLGQCDSDICLGLRCLRLLATCHAYNCRWEVHWDGFSLASTVANGLEEYRGFFFCEGMGSLEGNNMMCSSGNDLFVRCGFGFGFPSARVFRMFWVELIPPA